MPLNSEGLHAACVEIARTTLWRPKEEVQPTEEDVEALAAQYVEHALRRIDFVTGQGRDPNLLVRAARYLAHTHALPPMGNNTGWFPEMLDVLIELACPNTGLPRQGKAFMADLRRGISEKLKM
jgi:hypothetical protein